MKHAPDTTTWALRPQTECGCRCIVPVAVIDREPGLVGELFTVRECHGGPDELVWSTEWVDVNLAHLYRRLREAAAR